MFCAAGAILFTLSLFFTVRPTRAWHRHDRVARVGSAAVLPEKDSLPRAKEQATVGEGHGFARARDRIGPAGVHARRLAADRLDDFEAGGGIEDRLSRVAREASEIPWLLMHRPCLVAAGKHEPAGLQHAVQFERDLPRHREMLEDGKRHRRDEAPRPENLGEPVRVAHDVNIRAGEDVEADVVEVRGQMLRFVSAERARTHFEDRAAGDGLELGEKMTEADHPRWRCPARSRR